LDVLEDLGLWLDLGFILLDPYSTLKELETNLEFLRHSQFIRISEPGHELISSLGALIALEDSPIHRHLAKKGILRGNDVGYQFQDPDIEAFYKGMSQWNRTISKKYFEFNNTYMFNYYAQQGHVSENFLDAHRLCMQIDIDFLIQLKDAIKNNGRTGIPIDSLVSQYKKRMESTIDAATGRMKEIT
ncbi:MAG: hypothetical protein GY757_01330, partial [bacterium]|nr:hypothetical protein [bacterium]